MGQELKQTGRQISCLELVKSIIKMVIIFKEFLIIQKNMEKGVTNGMILHFMKDNLEKI
jgi:hypothetical protein